MKRATIALVLFVAAVFAQGLVGAQVVTNPAITGVTSDGVRVGTGTASAAVNGTLDAQASSAGVCTAADLVETTAWTYTLPANTLSASSRGLRVHTYGTTAANANVKTVKLYFGTNVFTIIAGAVNNSVWFTTNTYIRMASNSQQRMGISGFGNAINAPTISNTTETDTAGIIIKVTIQNGTAAASDICWRGVTLETIR